MGKQKYLMDTHCKQPRRTVFPKRASRVCQRAREKESVYLCVCVWQCVRPAAKNIREYARCGCCVSMHLYLYLYPITRVGAQKYTSPRCAVAWRKVLLCLRLRLRQHLLPRTCCVRLLRLSAMHWVSSVCQRRRRRRRHPSMSSTRSKCVYLGQQPQQSHLALTPLARRAGWANVRMSRLIGFLAVGLGGFSTWLECPHNNTRKRTEPGPAQAESEAEAEAEAQHTCLLRRAERAARYWNDQWMKCGIKKQHFTLVACILQIRGSSRSLGWSGDRLVGRLADQ